MPDAPKTLGQIAFETRESSRLRRYGYATKWEEQIAAVRAEYEEMVAAVVAESNRRGS